MPVGIGEILEMASQQDISKEERIGILKENDSDVLRKVLFFTYSKDVESYLPTGKAPPYKPNNATDCEGIMYHVENVRMLDFFFKGFGDADQFYVTKSENFRELKRQELFIRMLETVAEKDAKVLLNMINGKQVRFVPAQLLNEAFGEGFVSIAPRKNRQKKED